MNGDKTILSAIGKIYRDVFLVINSLYEKKLALRAADGPYRFLIKDWRKLSNIDLAVNVFQTEYFRQRMDTLPLSVDEIKSILVLAPHQDDEAIGAGGLLVLAKKAGVKIDVLFMTDGAQDNHPKFSKEQIIKIRDKEAHEVCVKIGAEKHNLGIPNMTMNVTRYHLQQISELINEIEPQVVLLPWLLDRPSKHRFVSHCLFLANQIFPLPNFETWGYQVHNTLWPNGYIDITAVVQEKRELLRCYKSQNAKYYEHLAMSMNGWNARFLPFRDDISRYIEIFFALPSKELLRCVESFYLKNLKATYNGEENVYTPMIKIHNRIVNSRKKQK